MSSPHAELVAFLAAELARPMPSGAGAAATRLRELHGDTVRAVLFYGSCLRGNDDEASVLDFYVLVDRYRDAYRRRHLVALNTLLPPNVFYLEAKDEGRTVRVKYAVLSVADFVYATSHRTFESYFWARFAQPCALVYASDAEIACQVSEAMAEAVTTFVRRALPLVPETFHPSDLWTSALRETYRCEVRAERVAAPEGLYGAMPERYDEITGLALRCLPLASSQDDASIEPRFSVVLPAEERRRAPWLWALRRVHGKTLFLLRLARNAFTFEGGVDYVIDKVERHSGQTVDPTWREGRFRMLSLGAEVVRLYRRRAFR